MVSGRKIARKWENVAKKMSGQSQNVGLGERNLSRLSALSEEAHWG